MKKPKLNNLVLNKEMTLRVRDLFSKPRKVRITIHVDEDILKHFKKRSTDTGSPYQRLMNDSLRKNMSTAESIEKRLEVIERKLSTSAKRRRA